MGKIQDADQFYAELGAIIRSYRTKQGYSQDQLAKFLDLTRTSVVNIEKGRQRPPLHTVYDLAVFFGVSLASLFPSNSEKQQMVLSKSIKDSFKTIGRKFKDVPINEEKLTQFIHLSSQA
jgi:DNA-binding XRE family transcriptional regulator